MAAGDHIKVRRMGGLYRHHGIDAGDGTVIHFSGEPFRTGEAMVCRVSMEEFLQGEAPVVVEYGDDCLPADEAIETALAHLGAEGYDLWLNNCEHFICYCKTGSRKSAQIERVARTVNTVAKTAVLLSAVVIGTALRAKLARR
jgi:hypothetical protein